MTTWESFNLWPHGEPLLVPKEVMHGIVAGYPDVVRVCIDRCEDIKQVLDVCILRCDPSCFSKVVLLRVDLLPRSGWA